MTSAPAIGFEYRPSYWLGRLVLFVSLLAVLATCVSGVVWAVKLVVTLVVTFAFLQLRSRLRSEPVEAAGWARDGDWSLRMRAGEDALASLASFRVIGESMVWLRLSLGERRHAVLLLAPDNSDADTRRRLRMRLAQLEAAGHSGG